MKNPNVATYFLIPSCAGLTRHWKDWISLEWALRMNNITLLVCSEDGTQLIPFKWADPKAFRGKIDNALNWRSQISIAHRNAKIISNSNSNLVKKTFF